MSQSKPFALYSLRSRSCHLKPRRGEDAPFLRQLWADQEFMRSFHRLAMPLPEADDLLVTQLEKEFQRSVRKADSVHWVVQTPSGKPVGLLSLTNLSRQHRRAEVLVGVLPGAPFGVATAAMLMLFRFYFQVMRFHKLYSLVYAGNEHSLKSTLHLGFKIEGVLRGHVYDAHANSYVDLVQTGLLAQEAFSAKNTRLAERLLNT